MLDIQVIETYPLGLGGHLTLHFSSTAPWLVAGLESEHSTYSASCTANRRSRCPRIAMLHHRTFRLAHVMVPETRYDWHTLPVEACEVRPLLVGTRLGCTLGQKGNSRYQGAEPFGHMATELTSCPRNDTQYSR